MLFKSYYSQYGQDKFLDKKIFKKRRKGFFVEIGAYDGKTLSNTYFFEKYRRWTGICIEPNPVSFDKLVKNRKCICINKCVSDFNGKADFLQINGYSDMLSGIDSRYDSRHKTRIKNEINRHGGSTNILKTDCIKFDELFKNDERLDIDYVSIDTEGNEKAILVSIDFLKYNIKAISIENNYENDFFKNHLYNFGYELVHTFKCDELYVKK
ncbi:MAG: FkbM family methyltransferase [Cytophagales bacterium]|nr:FkbM family methyltransferase [Cytophagales bacterium]